MATKQVTKKAASKKRAVTLVKATLTSEQRLTRIEKILAQFDEEPPPMPEGLVLKTRLDALEGRVESHAAQMRRMDRFPDSVSRVNARLTQIEKATGVAADAVPRDHEHERAKLSQELVCGNCNAGTMRVVSASNPGTNEVPCSVCSGGVMRVTNTVEVAPEVTDAPAA